MNPIMETEKIELLKKLIDEAQIVVNSTEQAHLGGPNCLVAHYFAIVMITLIGGAIGGIARGASDRLNRGIPSSINYSYSSWGNINKRISFWLQHIFLGIGGSFSAIFITLMFSKYILDIASLQSITLYSSIAVLGGIMAKRCLPALGDRIMKELEQVKNENKTFEKRVATVEKNIVEVETKLTYRQLIDSADKALSDKNPTLIKKAISDMEDAFVEHGVDRQYTIKLGRLYRKLAENGEECEFHRCIDKAISTLKKFIEILTTRGIDNEEVRSAIGTAYFNIACYYVLKSRRDEEMKDSLLEDALNTVHLAFKYYPYLRTPSKTDSDLKEIWNKIK